MPSIVYSKRLLDHNSGPKHPESPARLTHIVEHLTEQEAYDRLDLEKIGPLPILEKDLLRAHEPQYLEELEGLSAKKEHNADNAFYANTYQQACLSAGVALAAAQDCIENERFSIALCRPPGHHAGRAFFGGFCYLNNAAIALKGAMEGQSIERAMVVDIDCHAGNGTQDIFYHDDSVYVLDLHQDPRTCFPFHTGFESENNSHVKNIVLKPGTDDATYLQKLGDGLDEALAAFEPQLIAVSAGFDTFALDRATGTQLNIADSSTYTTIARLIAQGARAVKAPVFSVLEGGYYLPKLGENVLAFIEGFA